MRAFPIFGWSAYALSYFLFCFRPGVLCSDDFGYLRSIVGTLQRGRPYTYDWLEPYGAVFSSACALLYKLTGNFYLSTFGFQAFCVLALFPLLYRLLAARVSSRDATVLTWVLLTTPVFLAKEADFHGGMSTLALFLLALNLFAEGKTSWFFLVAFLAAANRQNQIALLILPGWNLFEELKRSGKVTGKLLGGIVAAGVAFVLPALFMNPTYARTHSDFLSDGPFKVAEHGLVAILAGIFITLAFSAVFSALWRSPLAALKMNLEIWPWPTTASLALLLLMPFWPSELIRMDTPFFGLAGWSDVNRVLPWLLLICLWFADYRLLRPSPYLALIGGYILVASVRGIWWDYYFMEISLLCLLLAVPAAKGSQGNAEDTLSATVVFASGILLAANMAYAYFIKVQSDKQALAIRVFETLERQGKQSVEEMSGATFGLLGWKLLDYFIATEGPSNGKLTDFLGYVRRDRVVLETQLPWRRTFKNDPPASAEFIEGGEARIGFSRVAYRVLDLHGSKSDLSIAGPRLIIDSSRYHRQFYPLNDSEWKRWLDSLLTPTIPAAPR